MDAWAARAAAGGGAAAAVAGPDLDATRPATDEKLYKLVTLENGLECLLISDTYGAHAAADDDDDDDDEDDDRRDDDGEDEDEDDEDEEDDRDDDEDAEEVESEGAGSGSDEGDKAEGFKDSGGRKRRAAVCASVGVGSFYDPESCQGLAHFLEHMLFMGSKKYPTENAFDAFISRTGGESNAYTEGEQTAFYFTTKASALAEALDIFAQFFVSPLMLEDAVDRELNAIESEFQLSRSNDLNRLQEVLCRTARRGHPLSLFGWGNLRSLREDPEASGVQPLEMLRALYDKYYVAPNLKLVICAPLPLEELERIVVEQCSCIRARPGSSGEETDPAVSNGGTETHEDFEPLSLAEHGFPFQGPTPAVEELGADAPMHLLLEERVSLQCVHFIVPIRDVHQLHLTWQIPSQLDAYKSKPNEFLSHLLGHESKGSILSVAKARGWATSLTAGTDYGGYEANTACMLFPVQMTLTQKGMCEWKSVVALVMEYLGLLRAVGPLREVFDEIASLAEVDYRFLEESEPEEQVQELSGLMLPHRQMAREDLLTGPYLLKEWKPDEIEALMAYFTPENLRVDLVSSYFGLDRDFKSDHADAEGNAEDENEDSRDDSDDDDGGHHSEGPDADEDEVDDDEKEDDQDGEIGGEGEDGDENEDGSQEPAGPLLQEDFPDNPALAQDLVPLEEPYFGTRFWIRVIDEATIDAWNTAMNDAEVQASSASPAQTASGLHIPDPNPYVPKDLSLRGFPAEEALHPLVGSFVRVQTSSNWAYGFVQRFDGRKQQIEVAVEDDIEDRLRWFKLDDALAYSWSARDAESGITLINAKSGQMQKMEIISGGKSERGWQQLTAAAMRLFDLRHVESVADRCPEFAHFYEPRLANCSTEQTQIHWLHSRAFAIPKAHISLGLVCGRENAISQSPLHSVASSLFINLIGDELNNESYMASMAGLYYSVRKSDTGILVRFSGYSDRIFTLVDIVLRHVFRSGLNKDPEELARRYAMRRESLLRFYRNVNLRTGHHASAMRLRVLKPRQYDSELLLAALDDPVLQSVEGMLDFVKTEILSEVFVDGLICGNVLEAEATRLHDIVTERLEAFACAVPLPRELYPKQRVIRLAPGEALRVEQPCRDPNNANNSLVVYFQIGEDSLRSRVLVDIIEELMEEPIYDTLRTKYQLGYSVSCSMRYTHKVLGFVVRVTSDTHSGDELEAHVFAFLQSFLKFLEDLDEEQFEEHLHTAVEIKLEEDNNLGDEARRLWETIADHTYEWHTARREAFSLFGLTREDVIEAYKRWLLPTEKETVRVVSVRSTGPAFSRAPGTEAPPPPPDAVDPSSLPVFTLVDDFEALHASHDHYSLVPPESD